MESAMDSWVVFISSNNQGVATQPTTISTAAITRHNA